MSDTERDNLILGDSEGIENWGVDMPSEDEVQDDEKVEEEVSNEIDDEPLEEAADEGEEETDSSQEEKEEKDTAKNYKAAMREEREKRKAIERQLSENAQKMQRMEQIFAQLQQASLQKQAQEQVQQVPSYEEDPIENLRWQQEYIRQQQQQIQSHIQQQQIQQHNSQRINEFMSTYSQKAREFAAQQPDFRDAYSFITNARMDAYKEMGYSHEEADYLVKEEEMVTAAKALREQKNPAEIIYNIAKKFGYTGTKRELAQSNGKLNSIEKGMRASKSLSNAGGGKISEITLERLASLDADSEEFDRAWKKLVG